jgi:predicted XRE-type DNA-binding protein
MSKTKSAILEAVHETAKGLYDSGVMNHATMQKFDRLCLSPLKQAFPKPQNIPYTDEREKPEMIQIKTFDSVWDALADTPEQAASLKIRAELMSKIVSIIKTNDWSHAAIAADCGITQPRMNHLMFGRLSKFSLDELVNIATVLSQRVHFNSEAILPNRN